MLIAGDIGGTKTLLALYDRERGLREPIVEREYPSGAFPGLEAIVRTFLADIGGSARAACFDVAGPVLEGRAHLTNLPWVLDEAALATDLGLSRVVLLNDLLAVAYAVPHLLPADLHVLNTGRPQSHGPLAVVAPGTGLGEAFLIWNGSGYLPCSSEGGHADFAPADDRQAELRRHVAARFGHVAYERVCSGSGMPNIYDFLRDSGEAGETEGFGAALAAAPDRTPLIVHAGLEDPAGNPLAAATIDLFLDILAAEAGNLALKVLATGGVYLAGGMPLRVLPRLDPTRFMRAFAGKGRFRDLLSNVPVNVVTTRAALLGAAIRGMELLDAG